MKTLKIEIDTSNAAFSEYHIEVARILHNLANNIEQGVEPRKLLDLNGNSVGIVQYK